MEPIQTLIVDDEPLARRNLRARLKAVDDFLIVGECATGREAVAAIAAHAPEVVFLDIRMPDLDGFGVLENVPPETMPIVVFVTAYDRYALDAFRVHALDYLLKPFEEERFAETLASCRQRVAELRRLGSEEEPEFRLSEAAGRSAGSPQAGEPTANHWRERLVIKSRGRVFFLKIEALDWIEAYGDHVRVHAGGKSYLLRKTLGEMETRLDPRAFVRLNRSAVVNLDRVLELVPETHGELRVRLTCGGDLKLTRTYRERLESLLGDRL